MKVFDEFRAARVRGLTPQQPARSRLRLTSLETDRRLVFLVSVVDAQVESLWGTCSNRLGHGIDIFGELAYRKNLSPSARICFRDASA
jgi:hypothetical protein